MGGVHGQAAQKEKARKRAEKRAAKEAEEVSAPTSPDEGRIRMGKVLEGLFREFLSGLKSAVEVEITARTRAMKRTVEDLRGQLADAKRTSESRRAEIDKQVARARSAEASNETLKETASELRGKLSAAEVSEKALKAALAKAEAKKNTDKD